MLGGFSYAEISHLSRNRAHCHADFDSRLADTNTKRLVKAVFSCLNKHLAGPGRAKPLFVNENNALHATFKPQKLNVFNGIGVSIENLQGKVKTGRGGEGMLRYNISKAF